jgi:hypothetical protein
MKHLIIIIIFILTGCAQTVSTLKTDQDKLLSNQSGYLLIGIETNRDLKSISISGTTNIQLSAKDLRRGSNFILVDLPAGTYVIEKVHLNNYWRVEMEDSDYWDIKVLPEKINYVGHLNIGTSGFGQIYSRLELINKSSYAMEFMEERFPTILESRDMHYGGPGDDSFFDFIKKDKEFK